MSSFYDIFSVKPKEKQKSSIAPALEREEQIFLKHYIDYLYDITDLNISLNYKAGIEEDDPFSDIIPESSEVDINQPNDDPMSMENNNLGDNSPFDGLVDESGNDQLGDMFGDNSGEENPEQQAANDQIVVDREKLLRAAYNLGDNIRKLFPNRFLTLRETIQSNLNNLELLELSSPEDQEALRKLILLLEEQIKNIDIFLDIIAEQTFDTIFRKYTQIFTCCRKIKDAYEILISEDDKKRKKSNKNSTPQQ